MVLLAISIGRPERIAAGRVAIQSMVTLPTDRTTLTLSARWKQTLIDQWIQSGSYLLA